jgi:ornithine carbamoyltransferase
LNFRIASPEGYSVDENILKTALIYAEDSGAEIVVSEKPNQAVLNADIIYTDVWTSMGQEEESKKRRKIFADYQVNSKLLALAREGAIFMHPLPAHRGDEVAEGVLDSPASVVFDQAENRMHLTKTLLVSILGGLEIPLPGY